MTTQRAAPGLLHGLLIVALAWVGPTAAVVIAPILPTMAHLFRGEPGVDVKIALVASAPALLVAISALPYGFLVDRLGRRKLLLGALLFYGAAGIAPYLLNSLDWIVVSRFAVGIGEGAVFTTSTALLADYFTGAERERWMAAQTGAAPLAAVGLVLLGGALGAIGWHTPFLVYALGWVLVVPVLILLYEPARPAGARQTIAADFKWNQSIWISLAIAVSMVCFMLTVIQFSFLVTERGMTSPASIGLWAAVVTLGNPIGSLIFVFLRLSAPRKLLVSYVLFAVGFLVMGGIATTAAAVVGSLIANIGAGIMFPTLATWLLATLPVAVRGRGTGLFVTATFLGQFLGPLVILGLERVTGTLSHAVATVGCLCALAAGLGATQVFKSGSAPSRDTAG